MTHIQKLIALATAKRLQAKGGKHEVAKVQFALFGRVFDKKISKNQE